jgi:hypothetical protein
MRRVTLQGLPITETTRQTLLGNPSVAGALVSYGPEPDLNVRVHVFGPGCLHKTAEQAQAATPGAECLWERDWKPTPSTAGLSRTAAALALIDSEDITPYSAAMQCGVDVSAVYRALNRRARPKCQCCGQVLREEVAA